MLNPFDLINWLKDVIKNLNPPPPPPPPLPPKTASKDNGKKVT